jgi:predicted nucleic acid-binding Zn ribbon protein
MGQPVADLRGALLSARERGIAFDEAWRRAMNGRNGEWREALTATRDGWARAYAGAEPTGAELALIACGTSHWGHRFSIDGPRHCGYCDSPFAPENEQQKFCSPSCKRAAAHDRHNRRRTSNRAFKWSAT